jgi:hypothetical protein
MELEYSFMKAPAEGLNNVFRNSQKLIEKEISLVVNAVSTLEKKKDMLSKEEAKQSLTKLVGRLQGLKRKVKVSSIIINSAKLEDTRKEEEKYIQRCKLRYFYHQHHEFRKGQSFEHFHRK